MPKILVIEDEALLRQEIMDWLSLEDYQALGAGDGVSGVEAALQHVPDLIICDVTMPRLDGFGVLLELRANPTTARIPFIFMTARAAHEDIRHGMNLGADDYITKPFKRIELFQAIEARLQKKAKQDAKHADEIEHLYHAFEQERSQRLLKAKLIAMFSHDFRNPLSSILSSETMLRDYADRMDEQRRVAHLNRIEASVRQLMQMLDDMLMVAQMETGNLEYQPEPLDLSAFFRRMTDEFIAIHGDSYRIVYQSNDSDTALMADPRLLRQIAANLISNAIKYSSQGSEVAVSTTLDHDRFNLTVEDHGIGIPEADQSHLFAEFQRGSNVGHLPGTGLGLSIVKQAVDLHGGLVKVSSREGQGTTVVVSLPARVAVRA